MIKVKVIKTPLVSVNVFSPPTLEIGVGAAIVQVPIPIPPYEGDYQVTPRTSQQVLPTKDLQMLDDVTVFEIPFASVSNPDGGLTVTIAE